MGLNQLGKIGAGFFVPVMLGIKVGPVVTIIKILLKCIF